MFIKEYADKLCTQARCKQQVQSQFAPSQHPSSWSFWVSPQSFTSDWSDTEQQDAIVVMPPTAPLKPATNADALMEVENTNSDNMRAIPFTNANIRYSLEVSWKEMLIQYLSPKLYNIQALRLLEISESNSNRSIYSQRIQEHTHIINGLPPGNQIKF